MSNEITRVSIDVLKVHPRNTEFFDDISGQAYEEFKNSINEEGIISELIVSPDMTIISGHQRYKAAKDLGIKIIPVRIREDLIDEDKKLKILLASNFGREKNNEAKKRKIAVEYVRLCGIKRSEKQPNGPMVRLKLDEIANQLSVHPKVLQRMLRIERNLTEDMKEYLDSGIVTSRTASDIIAKLSDEEQEKLISQLDSTKKYTQKQIQKYVDEMQSIKKNPPKPSDYDSTKRQLQDYKEDYRILKQDYDSTLSELQHLRKQIQTMSQTSPTEQYNKKLKDSTIFFCSKIADFIENVGGYVWLTDHISELPEYEKKSFISAINAISAWSQTMLQNINEEM